MPRFEPFPDPWVRPERDPAGEAQNAVVDLLVRDYLAPDMKDRLRLEPHQWRILNHMFSPVDGRLRYDTMVWSCIKKSGKTELAAGVMHAWARVYGGDCYSIANDLKQAQGRAFDRVWKSLMLWKETDPMKFAKVVNPDYHEKIVKRNREGGDQIVFRNGARLMPIPCDPYGEAGGMQTLTVWDELWAYRSEVVYRLWEEMQPLPPGVGAVKESVRFVVTYAGWYGESELLWSLYESVVKPDAQDVAHGVHPEGLEDLPVYCEGRTCVYWDHEPRMPWHTDEFMREARRRAKTADWARLWQNRWTTGEDAFIDMKTYDMLVERGRLAGFRNHLQDIAV